MEIVTKAPLDPGRLFEQISRAAGTDILRNADVQLKMPCYVGPVIFGIGVGTRDSASAAMK